MADGSSDSEQAGPTRAAPASKRAPTRVALLGLGCRVNRADLDALATQLGEGFELVPPGAPADVVVVNTCTVTSDADSTARQAIRRAAREHPGARIVATGCYAEVAPGEVEALPGVTVVIGARAQGALPGVLARLRAGDDGPAAVRGALAAARAWGPPPLELHGHTRPFLKLQDGCDGHCSYCVVPLARGASRSRPFDEALAQLVALGARHREVVVTGVHLGAYGRDLEPRRSLAELLREAVARGLGRIRLSSIEPLEFPSDLLLEPGPANALCEHFHLPLQSGSDRVLAAMRRPYRAQAYRDAILELDALVPGACLGADVLVGFPGETDADHAATRALVESLPLAYLHVFPFSPRPGTDAAAMGPAVPPPVVDARAAELRGFSDRRWRAYLAGLAGRELEVIVERVEGGLARGTSRQYASVRWPSAGEKRGALSRVRVEASDGHELFGIRATTFQSRLPP